MSLAVSAGALVFSFLCVAGVRRWAGERMLDIPGVRSLHRRPIPRGGGVGIVIVVLLGTWSLFFFRFLSMPLREIAAFSFGGTIVALAGWLDDIHHVSTLKRLVVQTVSSMIVLAVIGSFRAVSVPHLGDIRLYSIGLPLTFIWIVGLTNAHNFMDGIDGMAGGQGVVAGLGWTIIGFAGGCISVGLVGMLLAASSLGFLFHNWPPARIFMGDVGSAFIGFTLAVLPIMAARGNPSFALAGVLLAWPFVLDTSFTLVRRLIRGENIFEAHRSHLYQRLVMAGCSHRFVTLMYMGLAATGAFLAFFWVRGRHPLNSAALLAPVILFLALWRLTILAEKKGHLTEVDSFMFRVNRKMTSILNLVFHKVSQGLIDLVIFMFSLSAAYVIRFEGVIPDNFFKQFIGLLPYVIIARSVSFQVFSVYKIVWRYISIRDAWRILKASLPVTTIMIFGRYFMPDSLALLRVPISVIVLEFLLAILGTAGIRMVRRVLVETMEREDLTRRSRGLAKTVLLIGAGDAGNMVAKELGQRTDLGFQIAGFVDDDPKKTNSVIQGVRVLGRTSQIPEFAKRFAVDEAIIAIANASSREIRRIVDLCESAGVKVKIVPGLFEMLDDRAKITRIREVNIDDLLGRNVVDIKTHHPDVVKCYWGKRILVTGAGGSIGSELCRQLCRYGPKELILLDKDENSIFDIDSELQGGARGLRVIPIISNIKNEKQLETIFADFRPEVVFHAAAHKHVPLMESNVSEAVINNVQGTLNAARLADRYGGENFIFISSDKAVNPTSVMGVTKKLGEMIIQDIAARSGTKYSCVRFGNVLGSRGSVVPVFQKQIAQGGPVTVTHPQIERFFMSVAEAVSLIIQAGSIGTRGEIFVLDMGKLVKIRDLAADLIRLSGFRADDIEIKYIGLRPGEKLYEEIMIDKERDQVTRFEKIFVTPPVEGLASDLQVRLAELVALAEKGEDAEIVRRFQEMNIGYRGDRRGSGR